MAAVVLPEPKHIARFLSKSSVEIVHTLDGYNVNLNRLVHEVLLRRGSREVRESDQWSSVAAAIGLPVSTSGIGERVAELWATKLLPFERLWQNQSISNQFKSFLQPVVSTTVGLHEEWHDEPITSNSEVQIPESTVGPSSTRMTSSSRPDDEAQRNVALQGSLGSRAALRDASHDLSPNIQSFSQLVLSNSLPLPPSQTCLPPLQPDANESTRITYYALRCHELHDAFRKATENKASESTNSQLLPEESVFLRSLLAIMRNNKGVQVPSRRQLRATCTSDTTDAFSTESVSQPTVCKTEPPADVLKLLGRTAPIANSRRSRDVSAMSTPVAKSSMAGPSRVGNKPRTSGDMLHVELPITRKRRAILEACGAMTSADFVNPTSRQTVDLPLKLPLPIANNRQRGSRYSRPRQPETIPARFPNRGHLPSHLDARVLEENSLLKRCCLHECRWTEEGKVCDADLASEWHLSQHFLAAGHAAGARLGMVGKEDIFQCRWLECGEPTFWDEEDLFQHIQAKHIGRSLACPYEDCDFRLHNVSHLTRHIAKQHDDAGNKLRPMGDISDRLVPREPPPLPRFVRTGELTTPAVRPRAAANRLRAEVVRKKVLKDSLASDERQLHAERAPHILMPLDSDLSVTGEHLGMPEASLEPVTAPVLETDVKPDFFVGQPPKRRRQLFVEL